MKNVSFSTATSGNDDAEKGILRGREAARCFSQTTKSCIFIRKLAVSCIAILCMAGNVWAENAATIASSINAIAGPNLTATVSGNNVTVTGTLTATPSNADYLHLDIDPGITVIWQATLAGTPSSHALITLTGSGIFEVQNGGSIKNNSSGYAIYSNLTSPGRVNITGGTVEAVSGISIYNESTGVINVSGSATRISSANTSSGTIYLNNSGATTAARLVITGGTVENTTNNGIAIYNNTSTYSWDIRTGTVNVSGGIVSAIGGYAIRNNSSNGTVNISGGTVRATTGQAISNSPGMVTVSGGTVSATTGQAINNSGTLTISGGTVSATNGVAIINSGTVTVSGSTTRITSANNDSFSLSSSNGTIHSDGGTLHINGGTVENTAAGTNGNAIYIDSWNFSTINVNGGTVKSENGDAITGYYFSLGNCAINIGGGTVSTNGSGKSAIYIGIGTLRVTGGTITTTQNTSYAVYSESSVPITFGRSPTVTGRIYTHADRFEVLTSGADVFAPTAGKTYTLELPEYPVSRIAVTNGASFRNNFVLHNPAFALNVAGQHLAIAEAVQVCFNLNGGTGTTPACVGVPKGGTLASLPTPTRTGYTFEGWFTAVTGGTEVTTSTPINANMTLYAQWTLITYTITYNLNSGVQASNSPTSFNITSAAVTLPTPTRAGYVFCGWYLNSALTGSPVTYIPTGSTDDKTYWAKWDQMFTVTFDPQDGTVNPASGTTGCGRTLASLPTPIRTGYIFNGWFTATTGGTQVTTSTVFDANSTIYAQWSSPYTVMFDTNGGTVTPTTGTTGTDGKLASLPTPTRTDYIFKGWFTAVTGGTQITTSTVFSANSTIFAQWTSRTVYTITYNLNGGTQASNPPTSYTIDSPTVTLPIPTRDGYKFVGWYESSELIGIPATSIPTGRTGNRTYWAKWTTITMYFITYNLNGGTQASSPPTSYNIESSAVTLPTPTRSGYTFEGWYENSGLTGSPVATIPTGSTGNKTYWAKWTQTHTYTVTFNSKGGSAVSNATVAYGELLTRPSDPSYSGFSFAGWFKDENYSQQWFFAVNTVTSDITLYAKWNPVVSGIEVADAIDFKVYPNPTEGIFTLAFEEKGTYVVTITEMSGKAVMRQTVSDQISQMDISGLSAGVYLLLINDGERQSMTMIVKQ